MSSIYKNYQVNLGIPFKVKIPITPANIAAAKLDEEEELDGENLCEPEDPEDILADAKKQADLIIKEAGFEAERILKEAKANGQAEAARELEKARQEGFRRGAEEAEKKYEELLLEAQKIKEKAEFDYKQYIESIEADVVDVILDTARRIIDCEVKSSREYILGLVKQAFDKSSSRDGIILKVGPQDYDFVLENREMLAAMVNGLGELDIKCDPAIRSGGCILETAYGTVDASVQTKLRKVEEAFRNAICSQALDEGPAKSTEN